MERTEALERWIRALLIGVALGVAISGITAFPLPSEIDALCRLIGAKPDSAGLAGWIAQVREGLHATETRCPFLFYGTDWLAFGHLAIATAFFGPIKDPVRNRWTVRWGMIACLGTIPVALICGPLRGIPWAWIALDCSFGTVGIVPLIFADRAIGRLERLR